MQKSIFSAVLVAIVTSQLWAQRVDRPREVSGIYPHLAFYNDDAECGTGAVVPWAGKLWTITYSPHRPKGSSDKLYEISPDLTLTVRPESIGGTPANRMIHRESQQLFIGPYAIDAKRNVRVIPVDRMPGRHTGTARHLTDPANQVYYATMEEGFYEVDVHTLAVHPLYADNQGQISGHNDADTANFSAPMANLPGYHGKGLYSGQGRLVYANNGEPTEEARRRFDIPSGSLSEWDGKAWNVVRRNQFTEVTGPGGIEGNTTPATDPLWSIGWDHRSLILMLLDNGTWRSYRLPKASHSYDGAHGWNTEWPRIREIGERDYLMTMHGMFWNFPRTFSAANSAGISPRSTYLKVIGDFARWDDRVVFGCDDTAKAEFLNKRKAKGEIAAPQSHSNLWFVKPGQIDHLGPVIGRGGVWMREAVKANVPSDPYLFAGFERRMLFLGHETNSAAEITLEIDRKGKGSWEKLRTITLAPREKQWVELDGDGVWIRLTSSRELESATAWLQYANADDRSAKADGIFAALAKPGVKKRTSGVIRSTGDGSRVLQFAAIAETGTGAQPLGVYTLDAALHLSPTGDEALFKRVQAETAIPSGILSVDEASVIFVNDDGKRYRLPKGDPSFDRDAKLGGTRVDREVATERDLFNAHGTFYELPAENAGGFSKVRPVATHNRRIQDYCSYRGLLVISGLTSDAPAGDHVVRSDDGKAALWVGAIDDVWKLGRPRGQGGPWKNSVVAANAMSDPYLMTGYEKKRLELSHNAPQAVRMTIEVDVTGDGLWAPYKTFTVKPGERVTHTFPLAFQACWVRAKADQACRATAQLQYD